MSRFGESKSISVRQRKVDQMSSAGRDGWTDMGDNFADAEDDSHEEIELVDFDTQPLLPSVDDGQVHEVAGEVEIVNVPAEDLEQSSCSIAVQVFIPYLVAGLGMVAAGLVLDEVQHWKVYEEITEIFVLVPALLGLKGNLEMTLASRFSTHANLGRLDSRSEMFRHITGNLAVVQGQAAVVAFLASAFAITLGWIPKGKLNFSHALLLCAASMTTAALASFILSLVMIVVIIMSRKLAINPDNVATPIAASLGDLTTLVILSAIGTVLNNVRDSSGHEAWLAPVIIAFFVILAPVWIYVSYQNEHIRPVVTDGWTPVVFSMLISSVGGFILERTVATYSGIAVFQPVINGVGGNLVAVQASRIGTYLHGSGVGFGKLPTGLGKCCTDPCSAFLTSNVHSRSARVLLALVVPGQLLFLVLIYFVRGGHTQITFMFVVLYVLAALLQVALLLYICWVLVNGMWLKGVDPDNSAIPYLTALGDLFGTAFLAVVFHIIAILPKTK